MEIIKIGNWSVTDEGISWAGENKIEYFIPKHRINKRGSGVRAIMYDWLVHIPEK